MTFGTPPIGNAHRARSSMCRSARLIAVCGCVHLIGCSMPPAPGNSGNGNGNANGNENANANGGGSTESVLAVLRSDNSGELTIVAEGAGHDEPRELLVADLNADGTDDIVSVNLFSDTVSIYLSDGSMRLESPVDYDVGRHPIFALTGDVDNDGDLDIVVLNSSSGDISVLLNDGDGAFADAEHYENRQNSTLAVGMDLNDDGTFDLVTSNPLTGDITIYGNDGEGAFTGSGDFGVGRFVTGIVVEHLDGDDMFDIVTSNLFDGQLAVIRTAGDGGFETISTGLWPIGLWSADFNADGDLDLVTANALDDTVTVLLNDGSAGFDDRRDYEVGDYPLKVVVGDWNADGAPDLAVAQRDDAILLIMLNDGDGGFDGTETYAMPGAPFDLLAADLNGDGSADLACAIPETNDVAVLFGDGSGRFAISENYNVGGSPRVIRAADLDGDGTPELVAAGYTGPDSPSVSSTWSVLRSSVPAPRFWQPAYLEEAYERVGTYADVISLTGAYEWWPATEGQTNNSSIFRDVPWQQELALQSQSAFFLQMDVYPPPRVGSLAAKLPVELMNQSFASPGVRFAFKEEAKARANWYNSRYLCLATDINAYFEQQPEDFDNFMSLYLETRGEIKAIHPEMAIFVSFQYEQLLGRFGGLADQTIHDPHWNLIEEFEPHQDVVGVSSYPLVSIIPARFSDPDLIPDDYYSRLSEHTDLPVVFTSLGWSPVEDSGGTPESQVEFLRRFEQLTADLNLLMVNYTFLSDTTGFGSFFDEIGLFDREGRAREALEVWNGLWNE